MFPQTSVTTLTALSFLLSQRLSIQAYGSLVLFCLVLLMLCLVDVKSKVRYLYISNRTPKWEFLPTIQKEFFGFLKGVS